MTESFPWLAAFLIGLGSSAHCLGMCGGIAASSGLSGEKSGSGSAQIVHILTFHLGRIFTYAMLGLAAGLALNLVPTAMTPVLVTFRLVAGLLMVAMGLYLAGWWFGLTRLEKLAMPIWQAVQPLLKRYQSRRPGPLRSLLLGCLWGLLPCGLVYSSVAWSAAAISSPAAGLLMVFMGLGTLPALLPVSFLGAGLIRSHLFRKLSALALIGFGLWTLWHPLQGLARMLGLVATGDMSSMH